MPKHRAGKFSNDTASILNITLGPFKGLITLQKTSILWIKTEHLSAMVQVHDTAADILSKMSGAL